MFHRQIISFPPLHGSLHISVCSCAHICSRMAYHSQYHARRAWVKSMSNSEHGKATLSVLGLEYQSRSCRLRSALRSTAACGERYILQRSKLCSVVTSRCFAAVWHFAYAVGIRDNCRTLWYSVSLRKGSGFASSTRGGLPWALSISFWQQALLGLIFLALRKDGG